MNKIHATLDTRHRKKTNTNYMSNTGKAEMKTCSRRVSRFLLLIKTTAVLLIVKFGKSLVTNRGKDKNICTFIAI